MSRYRTPEPTCRHARKGIVYAGDPAGAYSATNVCDRPVCIDDAIEWAEAQGHGPATHRPDQQPAPVIPERESEPTLFDFVEAPS